VLPDNGVCPVELDNVNIFVDKYVGSTMKSCIRRKILPLCQNITFFTHLYDLLYCTNLNNKGSATVVWIIFLSEVDLYKSSELCKNIVSFCVTCEIAKIMCVCNYL
jgi:hypothetical protein